MSRLGEVIEILIPSFPILTRAGMYARFSSLMSEQLKDAELDRDAHRSQILAMAGFTFSALLATALLDASTHQGLSLMIFYLLWSFLCYMISLNLQGYKALRWHDQLGTALSDSAALALIMSVVTILWSTENSMGSKVTLTLFATLVWLVDHVIRVYFDYRYFSLKRGAHD